MEIDKPPLHESLAQNMTFQGDKTLELDNT